MLYQILTPIEATGHLGRVFNSYLCGLRSLEQVVVPHHSMAAHATLVAEDAAHDTQHVSEMGGMLYHLATLATSLHQLADRLMSAYLELETFVSEGADLNWYARHKQEEAIAQAGHAKKKPSNWRAKYQSLAPFQLYAVLSRHFVGSPGGGELIGTSQAVDFCYHSDLLRNGLTLLRDLGQPAVPSNLTTRPFDEVAALHLPAEQPDDRWDGYDVSLLGPEAVAAFELLLSQCQQAAAYYHSLAPTDVAGFRQLYQLLTRIVEEEEVLPL